MPKDDSVKKQLRSILVWASMALSLSLGGCAIYDWFSDPPPRNPPAELVQFSPSKTPHRLWSVNVGSAGNYVFEPAVVFDAVYNPEMTYLLRMAKEKGARIVSGLEMFVGQASLQYKLFTGKRASASFMRSIVRDSMSSVRS